jgi:8-oxo-dGTP pyrophosphatase MutT (NUDIX family)
MPDQRIHSVSVAGVVADEAGRVLIVQRRDNGRWEAPGGVLEPEETFEEGVVREVAEGTGVLVGVDQLTGVYKNLSAPSSPSCTAADRSAVNSARATRAGVCSGPPSRRSTP